MSSHTEEKYISGDKDAKRVFCAWTVSLYPTKGTENHIWTGRKELLLDGITYLPTDSGSGSLVAINSAGGSISNPEQQMTIYIWVGTTALRAYLANQHLAGSKVIVHQLYAKPATDGSLDLVWIKIPRKFQGIVSTVEMQAGIVAVKVATRRLDIDNGEMIFWSDEHHRNKNPGDTGLKRIRQLAEGFEATFPP